MAFRASNIIPESGYRKAKNVALGARDFAIATSTSYTLTTRADSVLSAYHTLRRYRDDLNGVAAIAGIAQYARDQEVDQAYDVVAEFTALVASIDAAMDEIETTFPVDGSGFLLEKKLVGEAYEFRTFTPATLATLRGFLDAVAAAVT